MRSLPPPSSTGLKPVRSSSDRLARVYDEEIHPLVGQRFADMTLSALRPGPRAAVLEIGCASGAMTAELVRRVDRHTRIVALDASTALVELARARVITEEHAGRRVFFRVHDPAARLPFAEETFDLLTACLPVGDLPDPAAAVADWARVVKPGGEVLVATPLRGTWAEPLDIFREVLVRTRRTNELGALDAHIGALPEADTVVRHLEAAKLGPVDVELRRWELVFRSGREFFYSPVIEHGPLSRWKQIVGRGPRMQETFLAINDAIDTYFAGHPFAVSVVGGRFSCRRRA